MHAANGLSRFVWLTVGVACAGLMGSPTCARGDLGVLVPSYFYPGTGGPGGVGDGWAAMTAAASKISVTAILNPASGPGSYDPTYAAAMTNLENAGGHVVAYVYTDNGNATLATVEGEISTYISQYGSLINGFFLDGMFITPSTLSYYQSLDSYIKGRNASYTVIGNPGQPFLNGVSPSDYLSTADVFNIFEGPNTAPSPGAPGFDDYPYGVNWFQSYPSNRFSNVIYDVPTSTAMVADLSKAVQLNAGYVYITDQTGGNPYSQLPSYWDQEVAAIAAVPEPGGLTKIVSAAVCGYLAMTVQWCRRRRRPRPLHEASGV
jgi:Spherulation-specific family 4